MPTVPYNPDNQVAPTDTPIPTRRLDTPFAAFGGTIAQATEHLGQAVSGVGDELFQRAMSMQDLYNHSQALQADTDFSKQAGDIHAKLSSMQGKDAVDYYANGYMQDLNSARQSTRDALPNDMARKIFDQSSMSIVSRTVFNGAGHAAQENKNYAIGTAAARVKESQNAALGAPLDEAGFQQHLADTVDNTRAQYQLKGADDDTITAAVHKSVSDLYIARIQGLTKTHPFQANDILNKAVADRKIEGEDLGKITASVQQATRSVGARNISNDIRSGSDLSPGAGIVSIGQAKLGITGAENGGVANYQAQGPEVPGRGRALGRYQIMPENLTPWLKEAGLPSMTPAEFLNSPSAQDKVFETHFGNLMTQYGNFNDAASVWFSGKTVAEAGNVTDQTPTSRGHSVPQYLATANRALAQGMPLGDQVSRGLARAKDLAPDDPLLGDFVQDRITRDYHEQLAVKRDDQFNNRQTVEAALIGGDQQGNLPTTLDQLKADPKVEAAWNNLEPSEQRRYLGIMAKLDKSDVAMTPQRLQEYQRLKGEAQSDPAAFLNEDVVGANLPINVRKELINDQIKKKANAETDPRVTQALQVLRPTMDSAGITRTNDQQGYDQFVGGLQGAIEDFATNNKRAPNAKEVNEIGQRLLQQVPGTGYFGSNVGGSRVYNVAVPDAERQKILADPFWSERGIVPTDDQIQRVYAGQTYQKLYGGKTKADTPSVPTSK